jgi:hypothetical protein
MREELRKYTAGHDCEGLMGCVQKETEKKKEKRKKKKGRHEREMVAQSQASAIIQ